MRLKNILSATALMLCMNVVAVAQSLSPTTKWHWDKGTIVLDTPKRPAGQQNVLGLTAPKLPTVRVGFVGLGMRGPGAVNRFAHIPGVQVVALCDYEAERAEACQKYLRDQGLAPAAIYSGEKGYVELCQRSDIDLVYVATDWDHHFPVAKCALENGKHTAIEVPSAMNLEQCWELIDLSEKTRKHCMILENCCYDYYEMNALNMAQNGVFGEVIRAEGAYIHNLSDFWEAYWKNPDGTDPEKLGWRMKYNAENRGDVYATHGLGPVAQCMNIHRGDRFTTLVAMDTKSFIGADYMKKKTGKECKNFRNGDQTTTLMRTAQGKVVEIQHNVMTPQPYNRLFKLTGTKGYATKYPEPRIALDKAQLSASGVKPQLDNLTTHSFLPQSEYDALVKKFYHPILAKYGEFHWQQTRFNINIGDTVYIYVSEEREIKYKMTVECVNELYDRWMSKEEEFWVDKERIQDESQTKYALLRLVAESHSGKLTEENLLKHGFLRAPQGIKYLDGELLKFIERKF